MQGIEDAQRGFLDVEALAGELLAPGGAFAFLAEHRNRLFPDSMMEDLFTSSRGRPSIPASVIGSVLVLQALEGLSDRGTAEALTFDLRWKAACGYGLNEAAFHPSTLTYWRKRLAASKRPHRITEAVFEVITETGVLNGRHRRAVDSTVLDDAVARQDTITQLIAVIRRFGRDVPDGTSLLAVHAPGYDYSRVGKPDIAWDDREAKNALISALVTDALALLDAVDPEELEGPAAETYALLALVAGQDVEPAEGSDGTDGRWRIARRVAKDRIISIVDPEARHAHKSRSVLRDGYKAHIVGEPETGLITNAAVTKAAGDGSSDAQAGQELLAADPSMDDATGYQVLGDSAYGSGAMLEHLEEAGHQALVKPKPLRPAVAGGYTLDDFVYDPGKGTMTCPNGLVRKISPKGNVNFGSECNGCPLREQCTKAKNGRKLVITEHHGRQRAHRAAARESGFQQDYRQYRPLIERSIAWLVANNNRRLRYRGTGKNHAWIQFRVAGLNLKRLLKLGLTNENRAWIIA
ncbi:IS1182 family transposase [Arthrobacter sp. U41]|uniref:IS1182 family transposase n=1 Tax=Arthrobacter sp. U41 TaxID=1849032 RepID=UPI0008595BB7|nr:IS1182 family transposase [Arthrobacter sp. U41]AOT03807.1 transposase [Arthrobacter sp. U41]